MKTILITGVSRGIGKALAERFLAEGYFVIGTSRSGTADYANPNLVLFPLELTNATSRETCVRQIAALGKKIDVLINNAAMLSWKEDDTETIDAGRLKETLETNLIAPIDFTERTLPLVNDGAHIVNISSRLGSMADSKKQYYPCYSISKAGLNMFTRQLAARLSGRITVSSIHPGFVKTDMTDHEGNRMPEEAAEDIYRLATSQVESGQFWYKGEKFPW